MSSSFSKHTNQPSNSFPKQKQFKPILFTTLSLLLALLVIILRSTLFRLPIQQTTRMSSSLSTVSTISRGVAKKVKSIETVEGQGAVVCRSIGTPALRNISPFLMLDHFRIGEGAGFPDHPHRGMTTVTYIIDGQSQHEDFAGHAGIIGPGDVQWMNAGKGIMHAEMPIHRDAKGNKLPDPVGLQLWVDLPHSAKKEPPSYQEYRAERIPTAKPRPSEPVETEGKGWTVKVVGGSSHGVTSPIELPKNGGVLYLDVTLDANHGTFYQEIPKNYNAFIYTLEGQIQIGNSASSSSDSLETYDPFHTMVLTTKGDGVWISNPSDKPARFALVAGEPLDQEVLQYGPFVMTNREEIQQTLIDFQTGSNGFEKAPGWQSKIGAKMR